MRLAPRFTAAVTLLALVVAGCGGSSVAYREVPGGPPELKVPGNAEGFESGATPTPTVDPDATETPDPDATETPTPESTDTGEAPTGDTGAAEGTTEGGTEAPATPDTEATDTAPPAGSDAEAFEDYCAENPGAC
jgi:hypothetical protein